MSGVERLYSALITRSEKGLTKLPAEVAKNVPRNGARLVTAQALQSSGDQTVNASTVLPWLFAALGVPPFLAGWLVPIRESLSMLPQAFLTPLVVRVQHRKWVFVTGALIQGVMAAVMAITAAVGRGASAGFTILAALAVFALGRCLCSIASKDVQGRTLPKGERGQITGLATTAAGIVAITLGLAIRTFGGENASAAQLAWLPAAGALLWALVAVVYSRVQEPVDSDSAAEEKAKKKNPGSVGSMIALLRDDAPFRNFVLVRSLLLVSSLSPALIVTLAVSNGSPTLSGLGGFILASGVASMIGGRLFGRAADTSSRDLMSRAAGAASVVILVLLGLAALPGFDGADPLGNLAFIAAYFLITLLHTGVRVGRKTYVTDMAEGDTRTRYTAVSNTVMGVVLLVVGGISSAMAAVSVAWALLFLAVMGLVGVFAGGKLPNVSAGRA